jgi:hypothetical protein
MQLSFVLVVAIGLAVLLMSARDAPPLPCPKMTEPFLGPRTTTMTR